MSRILEHILILIHNLKNSSPINTDEFNLDNQPLQVTDIAKLFRNERKILQNTRQENQVLSERLDNLLQEKEKVLSKYKQKEEEFAKKELELKNLEEELFKKTQAWNQKEDSMKNNLLTIEQLEKELTNTKQKMATIKADYQKLENLARETPQVKEERDALINTLQKMEKEKMKMLEELQSTDTSSKLAKYSKDLKGEKSNPAHEGKIELIH